MSEDRFCMSVPSGSVSLAALDALAEEALEALTVANVAYLRDHPETPPFFESGVRYRLDDSDDNEWITIPEILDRGHGDCDMLAPWLAAEIRYRHGAHAKVRLVQPSSRPEDERVRHAGVFSPAYAKSLAAAYPQLSADETVRLGYVDPSAMMLVRNG